MQVLRRLVPEALEQCGEMKTFSFLLLSLWLVGCTGAMGNVTAVDPTERGLSYVAAAVVTAAVIRAFFNK